MLENSKGAFFLLNFMIHSPWFTW